MNDGCLNPVPCCLSFFSCGQEVSVFCRREGRIGFVFISSYCQALISATFLRHVL